MYQTTGAPALVAAKQEEALTHGQVLYGLIKPTHDVKQVESTAALVNVIPRKRIYRMLKAEELDLFTGELMKRPLVIQPSAYIGRGLAAINFALCTQEERWIVMINQLHPKVLSNIQAGIAGAKQKMAMGEPFVLEFSFNAFLKRVYLDRLTKAALSARFTVIEFENAEIIIRYPGDKAHRTIAWEMKTAEMKFTFDQLLPGDIARRTVRDGTLEYQSPALRIVPPDELGQYLPGWNFTEEDLIVPDETSSSETDDELEGATGGYNLEIEPLQPPPDSGRMVGRRGRAKNRQSSNEEIDVRIDIHNDSRKYEVPVELHVPQTGGPQVLTRVADSRTPSPPPPAYEDSAPPPTYRDATTPPHHSGQRAPPHEQKYDDSRFPVLSVPNQPPRGGELSQHQQYQTQRQPREAPRIPTSPRTPTSPHTPTSPQYNRGVERQTPTAPYSGNDRYANVPISHSKTDSNDDGGFLSPTRHGGKLDANSNRTCEVDRYGNPVNSRTNVERPSPGYREPTVNRDLQRGHPESHPTHRQAHSPRGDDQYTGRQYTSAIEDQPVAAPRRQKGFVPLDRPEPLPRGLHRHQGSGRSVSSTSDSGFGETENGVDSSRHRNEIPGDHGLQSQLNGPHYNRAYVPESPQRSPIREQPEQSMDDIMAQHKALAAKMLHGDVAQDSGRYRHGYNQHDNRNHSDHYNKELQRYRQNINDLEDACDVPDVDFSRSRLQMTGREPVEESFI